MMINNVIMKALGACRVEVLKLGLYVIALFLECMETRYLSKCFEEFEAKVMMC